MVYRKSIIQLNFQTWQIQHQRHHFMRGIPQPGQAPFQNTQRQTVGLPLAFFKDRERMRFGLRGLHQERTTFLQSVPPTLPPWKRVAGCGGSGSPRIRQRKQWQRARPSSFRTPKQFPLKRTMKNACDCYRQQWKRGPLMCRNQYRFSGRMSQRLQPSNWRGRLTHIRPR